MTDARVPQLDKQKAPKTVLTQSPGRNVFVPRYHPHLIHLWILYGYNVNQRANLPFYS